ncbi:flagellar hook-basal body complex protein FliE [Nitrospira defluvii]|nr:flagellar hook-basal body complex protein FliE [Nitrospira defluvii]
MDIKSIGPHPLNIDKNMAAGQSPQSGKAFMETLKESLSQVNHLQKEADLAVTDLVSGKDQEIHQTMIAVEKADVSFQLMMQVRNKILSAYEEISRMQI